MTNVRLCYGRSRWLHRCKIPVSGWFCHHHKYQPLLFVVFIISIFGSIAGIYQDAIKPALMDKKERRLEFAKKNNLDEYIETTILQNGVYEVIDVVGFDEPVKHSDLEIVRTNSGVYILLEMFAKSGYYKYEVDGKYSGDIVVGELIATNDSSIHSSNMAVIIKALTNGESILVEVEAKALEVKLLMVIRLKVHPASINITNTLASKLTQAAFTHRAVLLCSV